MYLPQGATLSGGRYRIVRHIGSGGFGCTYEAIHVGLDKRVAIKEFFVKDFCERDTKSTRVITGLTSKRPLVERLREKFVEEAKALAALDHPGIISVTDVFADNDTAYYVMDYIDGRSLSDMVQNGPMPVQTAIRYMHQVSRALEYVHAHKRLHLDIKPANIMVDAADNAILIDFGASKQYDEVNNQNTSTLLGFTPGYAPLEQMTKEVRRFYPATDIYALGATLYKLVTGQTPPDATLLASDDAQLLFPPQLPAHVRETILYAMQSKRSQRPETVDRFLAYLKNEAQTPTPRGNEATQINDEVPVVNVTKSPKMTPPAPPSSPVTSRPIPSRPMPQGNTEHKRPILEDDPTPPKKKNKYIWYLVLCLVLIAGAVTAIVLVSNNSYEDKSLNDSPQNDSFRYEQQEEPKANDIDLTQDVKAEEFRAAEKK